MKKLLILKMCMLISWHQKLIYVAVMVSRVGFLPRTAAVDTSPPKSMRAHIKGMLE